MPKASGVGVASALVVTPRLARIVAAWRPRSLVFVSIVSELTIRSAAQQDLEQVLLLWEAAGSPPSVTDSKPGLQALLAFDSDALLVADASGALVGSLIAVWDGWRASFYRLAVDPGRRREGIATTLLHEGERRLQACGAIRLTAIVAGSDATATSFWQAAGYTRQPDQTRFVRHTEH